MVPNHGLYERVLSAMEDESGVSRSVLASVLARVMISAPADIARADIARGSMLTRRVPLNASAVSRAVGALVTQGLLTEDSTRPDEDRAGRPIKPLRLNNDQWGLMGINVIHHRDKPIRLTGVVTRLCGDILTEPDQKWDLPDEVDFDSATALADQIKQFHDHILDGLAERPQLLGIGVEVSSHVHEGHIMGATHGGVSSDEKNDLLTPLQQSLETPVTIDNDVNVLAVYETYRRKYEEQDIALVAVLQDGVGASLIVDGHVYRGGGGLAAEPGHLTVTVERPTSRKADDDRPGFDDLCLCEKGQHVDCYAVPTRLAVELAVQDLSDAAVLPARDDSGQWTYAAAVFGAGGQALGQAVASIVNIVNPSRVVLRLPPVLASRANDCASGQYLSELEKAVTKHSFSRGAEDARAGEDQLTIEELDPDVANPEGPRCAAMRAFDEFIMHARGRDHCTRRRSHRRAVSAV